MRSIEKSLVAAVALALLAIFGGVALAGNDDANAAEGEVTDTEVGDEESYYEVEVTLDDGSQVDVQLDEGNVVSEERETEPDENDSEGWTDPPEAVPDEDSGANDVAEDVGEAPNVAISGDALTRASDKALDIVEQELGQTGTVTETEVGDEESHYEVEVTLDDGSQVDVQLDETFNFVGFD
ncbi:MAG TPA: PepSY domain-containing protein [Acidimicrobiia bacterium]|nr:PepSY domain-containing protein [Acidimicrobiia bacterium]